MSTEIVQPVMMATESATNPLPPRYSSLDGALSPDAAQILRSLCAEAVHALSATNTNNNGATETYPPRYSGVFRRTNSAARYHQRHRRDNNIDNSRAHDNDSSLSTRMQPFEYHIKSGTGSKASQPWATLKVFSRSSATFPSSAASASSSNPGKMPKFTSRDLLQGCLELNLELPQNINSISLSLKGKIVTGVYEDGSYTFLDHSIVSWTRANGDPRLAFFNSEPTSSASTSSLGIDTNGRVKKFDGKLSGSYVWPFSFPFPSEISIEGPDGERQKYPAPQTFLERGEVTNVQYMLVLKMTHGLLRADSKLQTGIVYIPEIMPPTISLLRQVAYRQGERIPGPAADPLGWHNSSPVEIFCKLSNGKAVKLECLLSLANPLTYVRGTIIPIHLTIRSSDQRVLEGLSDSEEIVVRLTRRLQYYRNTPEFLSLSRGVHRARTRQPGSTNRNRTAYDEDMQGATMDRVVIDQIVWQEPEAHSGTTSEDANARHFSGEIHLPKEMQPSCGFCLFKVSYDVELLPFSNSYFKSPSSLDILVSQRVTIGTQHGTGPIPIPSTRPNIGQSRSRRRVLTSTQPRPDGATNFPIMESSYDIASLLPSSQAMISQHF